MISKRLTELTATLAATEIELAALKAELKAAQAHRKASETATAWHKSKWNEAETKLANLRTAAERARTWPSDANMDYLNDAIEESKK